MTDALDALASGASRLLGRTLGDAELKSFDKYLKLLQKWQKAQRLIGSADAGWIVENLFLDSLLFLKVLPERFGSLVDVGSGAGVPGIPIKIVRPGVRVALIESRAKRASFLSAVVRELELRDVAVVRARVEQVMEQHPRSFDAAVMRCAGAGGDIARFAACLVADEGTLVVSGPPDRRPLDEGEWVEVDGVEPGTRRRFVIYRRTA
jgi:16S rRNA (guanine527-N7)-methyltransferase